MTIRPASTREVDQTHALGAAGPPDHGCGAPVEVRSGASGAPEGAARVTVCRAGPTSVMLDVTGEIDLLTVDALAGCLLAALEVAPCRELLVDLGKVEFLSAGGIGAFAQAHARATERGISVRLLSVSRIARRALEVAAATSCFDTWPSVRACGPGVGPPDNEPPPANAGV